MYFYWCHSEATHQILLNVNYVEPELSKFSGSNLPCSTIRDIMPKKIICLVYIFTLPGGSHPHTGNHGVEQIV